MIKNRIIKFMLLSGSFFGTLHPVTHFNQTFLMPQRSLPRFHDFDSLTQRDPEKWHHDIKVCGFFKDSTNRSELGDYFGINGSNGITIGATNGDVLVSSFVLDHTEAAQGLAGTMHLNPRRTVWGTTIDFLLLKNINNRDLSLKITLPLECVTHDLGARVENEHTMVTYDGKTIGVLDYFRGNLSQVGDIAARPSIAAGFGDRVQKPLTHAKFGGKRTLTRLASVDLTAGYDFVHADNCKLTLKGRLSIPTGNTPKGEYLFEPIVGNGGHVEAGIGFDSVMMMRDNENCSINFFSSALLLYGCSAKEKRTLSIKDLELKAIPLWAHYELAGKFNERGAFPLANVTTIPVIITPQISFKGTADCKFGWQNFGFTMGYGLYAKQAEHLKVTSFNESEFALCGNRYDTGRLFMVDIPPIVPPHTAAIDDNKTLLLKTSDLYLAPATTPAQITHTIRASFYRDLSNDNGKYLTLGLGTGYELAADNAALSQYDIHLHITGYF